MAADRRLLPDATYVGSATCAPCHAAESTAWQASQHQAAMAEAAEATVRGRFDNARATHAGLSTTFFRRGEAFMVRTDGPDGSLQEFEVKYTFGVSPLQQYLVELPGGRLQALPFAWDTRPAAAGGQRWFHLYPEETIKAGDPLHWTGIQQNWNFMCADCHSTNLRKNYDPAAHAFATSWSEISVGCEACHGPGSAHVAWAGRPDRDDRAGRYLTAPLRDAATWTVGPDGGTPVRSEPRTSDIEIEVCARCHARRSQLTDDIRAGDPFPDGFRASLLEPGIFHPDGQQRDEVYTYASFLESRMYAGGVTCSDCHDPHSGALQRPGNATCTTCHAPAKYDGPSHHLHQAGTPAASCATCHMPVETYMVVDPRHDHSFRVPRPDRAVTLGVPDVCTTACHSGRTADWAATAIARHTGQAPGGFQRFAEAFHAGEQQAPDAAAQLTAVVTDLSQSAIARASALERLAAAGAAQAPAAAALGVRDRSPLVRRAAVTALQNADPTVRLQLVPPLLSDPARTVREQAVVCLADIADTRLTGSARAAFDAAFADFLADARFNADRPDAQANLGTVLAARGRLGEAQRAYEEAIRLAPTYMPAYVNLADLFHGRQDEASAERVLRQALAIEPDTASVHHALGLSLVRQKRSAEALGELAAATRLAPEVARYGYVEGVARHDTGHLADAVRVLEAAHQRHPRDRDILYALALYAKENGRADAAREYARRLLALDPADPEARALVEQVG